MIRTFSAALALSCGVLLAAASAVAQDYRDWGGGYGGGYQVRPRPIPRPDRDWTGSYDDRDEDDRSEEVTPAGPPANRIPPNRYLRTYRGSDPYWWRDDDEEWARRHWRAPGPATPPSREAVRPDTPREPGEDGKPVGVSGGPRPFITPSAPALIPFHSPYAVGSIVIDTSARKLYYITSTSAAFAYPIGVGREGFAWTGSEKVSRIADWPDWYPPAEMRQRRPELPERMLGGINNPLGAKAIYLGNTLYRIHGTNDPKSIGKAESSGCFRMLNQNVLHLASIAAVGTPVTVVRSLRQRTVADNAKPPMPRIITPVPRPRWYDDRYRDDYWR